MYFRCRSFFDTFAEDQDGQAKTFFESFKLRISQLKIEEKACAGAGPDSPTQKHTHD